MKAFGTPRRRYRLLLLSSRVIMAFYVWAHHACDTSVRSWTAKAIMNEHGVKIEIEGSVVVRKKRNA